MTVLWSATHRWRPILRPRLLLVLRLAVLRLRRAAVLRLGRAVLRLRRTVLRLRLAVLRLPSRVLPAPPTTNSRQITHNGHKIEEHHTFGDWSTRASAREAGTSHFARACFARRPTGGASGGRSARHFGGTSAGWDNYGCFLTRSGR